MQNIHSKIILFFWAALFAGCAQAIDFTYGGNEPALMQCWLSIQKLKGSDQVRLIDCYTFQEEGKNKRTYYRINETAADIPQPLGASETVVLPYGYLWEGDKMFLYDFKTDTETIAFDFSLSAGDTWKTYDGTEWKVTACGDTSFVSADWAISNGLGRGQVITCKTLDVVSLDGLTNDKWIEGIGSVHYGFCTQPIDQIECAHILFFNLDVLFWDKFAAIYLNFDEDPMYGGMLGVLPEHEEGTPKEFVLYNEGEMTIQTTQLPYSDYYYYYYYAFRTGDEIVAGYYQISNMLACEQTERDLRFTLRGIPEPASGNYVVKIGEKALPNTIPQMSFSHSLPNTLHDLQGRSLTEAPARGMYIQDGKVMMK